MKWAMVLVGTAVVATIVVVGAVVVITQEDKPATATAAYQSTTAPESTTADESTTTTASTATTEPTTTTQSQEVPDLSGVWHATKTMGGQPEEGTVLISQTGMTFTLSFSDGFECRPADACEFDGVVEVLENDDGETMYVWMASNSGVADDKGGTYETFFGLQPFSAYDGPDDAIPLVDINTGEEKDTPVRTWAWECRSIAVKGRKWSGKDTC
ncbi:MAG: hypothetical protein U9N78_01120, partial [Actinomycetota bacterium]|nr:hypothetical protein [Actinomycetota bacterium]